MYEKKEKNICNLYNFNTGWALFCYTKKINVFVILYFKATTIINYELLN